jgi:hypothetical protein
MLDCNRAHDVEIIHQTGTPTIFMSIITKRPAVEVGPQMDSIPTATKIVMITQKAAIASVRRGYGGLARGICVGSKTEQIHCSPTSKLSGARASALPQPKLLYPYPSTPSDDQRSMAGRPLQRKLENAFNPSEQDCVATVGSGRSRVL